MRTQVCATKSERVRQLRRVVMRGSEQVESDREPVMSLERIDHRERTLPDDLRALGRAFGHGHDGTPLRPIYAISFRYCCTLVVVGDWSFLTNHARALLFIADHPDARLRDLAVALDVTERTAYGLVADLADEGYVLKERDGRRNRYQIQTHLPLRDPIGRERTIGELLGILVDGSAPRRTGSRRG